MKTVYAIKCMYTPLWKGVFFVVKDFNQSQELKNVISDEWAREEDRNKYFDGTRYNRAWVLGRVHHG